MKIGIVTDTWLPQVNGVVTTLRNLRNSLNEIGHDVEVISFDKFASIPLPTYPELRLALLSSRSRELSAFLARNEHVHIATEGPVGLAARRWCLRNGQPFTTSFHTRFPEYVSERAPVPKGLIYAALRRFHSRSGSVMVSSQRLMDDLGQRGFPRLALWGRGVDRELFSPGATDLGYPGPVFLYCGRLAVEKSIEEFLRLDLPGVKLVVGDGPQRASLQKSFPEAIFTGMVPQAELPRYYRAASVFVFPSRTDTFGNVMLEAMACGVPVAAFAVAGPLDVVGDGGVLDMDLRAACLAAMNVPSALPRAQALRHSWEGSTRQFMNNVHAARVFAGVANP